MMLTDYSKWTYGAEHEWADFSIDAELPRGCTHNTKDHTVVNSNGIANDPTGKLYRFGGEINTRPTKTMNGQINILRKLIKKLPEAQVNYRSNLHIHIGVPGLVNDLQTLKQVQKYIHINMPKAFEIIEPIPKPTLWEYNKEDELKGALRRWKRRKVSHHTLLTQKRLDGQFAAKTCEEFFTFEVPSSPGRTLWHLQARLCVSLRQLLETDTIEFRHFPGTLDIDEFTACIWWCYKFLKAALNNAPIEPLLTWARKQKFPKFPPYIHWMEAAYRATVHDGSVPKDVRADMIKEIENGSFFEDH